MRPAVYTNEVEYLQTLTTLQEELTAIRAIRAALRAQMLTIATGKPTQEYFLNDGHTTIKRVYRTMGEITGALEYFEGEENRVRKSMRGGGISRVVGGNNLTGRR